MTELLHWFDLSEWPALVVLILLLAFVGEQMARPGAAVHRQVRRLTAGALVLYVVAAIIAWRPFTPQEFLGVLLRALLAAGVVYGASCLVLGALHHAIGDPLAALTARFRRWQDECRFRDAAVQRRREMDEALRQEEANRARQSLVSEQDRQRRTLQEESSERQRQQQVDEARAEVERFYTEHQELLGELLPSALLRSKVEARFAGRLNHEEAWRLAQELIAEIVPLVDQARAKRDAETEMVRQREQEAHAIKRQIKKLADEITTITQSAAFDPDVSGPELRALKDRMHELEEELDALAGESVEQQP